MDDVLIAGGGPAGALAAILLARAGASVRVFDRARFPRSKLCGDTLNPGACRVLADHLSIQPLVEQSGAIDGMLLTGPGGVAVRGRYGPGVAGRAIERRHLDHWLIEQAAAAGARIEEDCTVEGPMLAAGGARVTGLHVRHLARGTSSHPARMIIAADGRRSRLACALGLASHPQRLRRWAIGAYFENVSGLSTLGEMHVRRGHYIGVAPMPGSLTNACLVVPHRSRGDGWRDAAAHLTSALARDAHLSPRFARARLVEPPAVLGPMAVDVKRPGAPGLLLAGDAAGFIDPMTGDGLRFALLSSVLAARVALEVLSGQVDPAAAVHQLAAERRAAFAAKWRFNRALRRLVDSSNCVTGATMVARRWPKVFQLMIRYAGDIG